MRSEKEMTELILRTAREDERIRGVILEGSRVNPAAPKDIFQDYDVVYAVNETRSFREDAAWIDRFGARLYMQYPEDGVLYPHDRENCYGWLIQFRDGNRLDLHVCTPQSEEIRGLYADKMHRVLLDKDGRLPAPETVSDAAYRIRKPDEREFACVCNEFWWCTNNLAKGLWRGEIPYVMDMLNFNVRPMLTRMLEWKAGISTGFAVSAGKSGKYLYRYLPTETWRRYLTGYPAVRAGEIWDAVFLLCDLMDETSREVAGSLGFALNREEAAAARSYLAHVRDLPKDAKEIY